MTILRKLVTATPAIALVAALIVEIRTGAFYGGLTRDLSIMVEATLNVLLVVLFMVMATVRMRQRRMIDAAVQASFFIYVLAVLYYTVLPLPLADIYRSVAGSSWLADVMARIEMSQHSGWRWVNLTPLHKFKIYSPVHIQVTGNLALLFPLGIYLPLLYRRLRTAARVLAVSVLLSLAIETTQFTFSLASGVYHRTFDVDDIILNTVGAGLGYGIYRLGAFCRGRSSSARLF